MIPGLFFLLNSYKIEYQYQQEGNHTQSESNLCSGINIGPDIFKSIFINTHNKIAFLSAYPAINHTIPYNKLIINNLYGIGLDLSETTAAANQPAEKFTNKSARVVRKVESMLSSVTNKTI